MMKSIRSLMASSLALAALLALAPAASSPATGLPALSAPAVGSPAASTLAAGAPHRGATFENGSTPGARVESIRTPEAFFGFRLGTNGELARYPKVVDYLRYLAESSERVLFEERGKTTLGNPFVLLKISSPANLRRLDRLVEINHRLADPRGLTEGEAKRLAHEGVPFYFLYATIHSTEVGNGQAIVEIAHRMATDGSPEIREILENAVLLLVPSQNPDGQVLVIDHWYKTAGTSYSRIYPDLYHHYVGHDDNRDWFMFTQVETRMSIGIQNQFKPQVTHDMHQMGSTGARIFVPPFKDPYDPNIHPILAQGQAQIGLAMAGALVAEGKRGVAYDQQYDLWTPARQYMVYHGEPRILTEIASARLADPFVNPQGEEVPLGPQQRRWNYPVPYDKGAWHLRDIMDYGETAVFAGLTQVAKYHTSWLENFYKVHRDWVERDEPPYAFVIPAAQRDPFETYELLHILDLAEVEIHRARSPLRAGGRSYDAGSWVVQLAQPYGAFAKTMLEKQVYPDLRYYPGGPPIPPYDVTAQTLGMLMGVDVEQVDEPIGSDADLELLEKVTPPEAPAPPRPGWAYLVSPGSNATFLALARLQKAKVPVFRSAQPFESGGDSFDPGTWIVPAKGSAGAAAGRILQAVSAATGLAVSGTDRRLEIEGFRLKPGTRIGLWRAANNMPAGWMKWLFEQYEFDFGEISSMDFEGDLAAKYDVIVLPAGTSRSRIVDGLPADQYDDSWRWATGVGEEGWGKLAQWVRDGSTLVALGSAVDTARQLLGLPIEPVLPQRPRFGRRGSGGGRFGARGRPKEVPQVPATAIDQSLREAFQSPAQLSKVLADKVVDPTSVFFCPGSLLAQEYNVNHPVAYGMPAAWPVFFRSDQAYRLTPGFEITAEVVSRYPKTGEIAASGWLLGGELLRDRANVVSFKVGRGTAVTLGSQVAFRTQSRGTFKLLFNAIFQGPATRISARQLSRLSTSD
ncbi:MAG: M14 metallopeptidase family protein [Acidobacteriota bacterium]